jgi:hypothetical protein
VRMDGNEFCIKIYCGQTLEVNEEVADRNQDGEENARKLSCRSWRADDQDRGRWRYLLEVAKAHPGL